jgi:hypothetical protein
MSIFCLDNVHVQKNEVLACLEDFELDWATCWLT